MSIRTERVARLVQRDVADILANELAHEIRSFVTVTGARMTNDLGIAYVYVSVMGAAPPQREAAFRHLQELTPAVRAALAARMRHQLRTMPDVRFFLDETLEKAAHMEDLFARIRQERAGREADADEGDGTGDGAASERAPGGDGPASDG